MLDLDSKYHLSFYETLDLLGNRDNIQLVRHNESGEICVLKKLTTYKKEVYLFLQSHPMPYYPSILWMAEDPDPTESAGTNSQDKGILYILEEYVEGPSLQQYLDIHGPMQLKDALPIMLKLCQCLAFLHDQRPPIIHRDIKPSNIILTRNQKIKLIDFNTVRFYIENQDQDTQFMGTEGFAAPEQHGGLQSDQRTDIYALGVTFNYMLTLQKPAQEHTTGPAALIISRCTDYYPERRFPNVRSLQWNLEELSAQLSYAQNFSYIPESYTSAYTDFPYGKATFYYADKSLHYADKDDHHTNQPCPDPFRPGAQNYPYIVKETPRYPDFFSVKDDSFPDLEQLRSYLPPGFRSKCLWKDLLAAYLYPMIIWSSTSIHVADERGLPSTGLPLLLHRATYLLIVFGWIFLWFNYRDIQRHLPLLQTEKKTGRFLACLLYSFLYLFLLAFLLGIIMQFLS